MRDFARLFVLCSQVQVFIEHPERWAQVLGAAIPQTSNFFLNYVITRAFMLNFVRLLMPRKRGISFCDPHRMLSVALLVSLVPHCQCPHGRQTTAPGLVACAPLAWHYIVRVLFPVWLLSQLLLLLRADGGMWRWLGQMLFTGFTSFRYLVGCSVCCVLPAGSIEMPCTASSPPQSTPA